MIQNEHLHIGRTKLGKGGSVYKGTWSGAEVAVKEVENLSVGTPHELEAEVQTLKSLQHPNVVALYGYSASPKYFLVLEYMPQGSLHDLLHNKQADIAWDARKRMAMDITRGLIYLHAANIVHSNIKTTNVLLKEGGKACLSDFGLTKFRTLQAKGTIRWMAPELFGQPNTYTAKSDMYSLAVTLWELVSRKIPFQDADDDERIARWVRQGEREDIPEDCPPKLASVITVCWSGDPSARPDADTVGVYLTSEEDMNWTVVLSKRNSTGGGKQGSSHTRRERPVALPPPPPPSPTVKALKQLTDEELERWLTTVRLSAVIPKLREHSINGDMLAQCETIEDILEFVPLKAQAKLLLRKVQEVKSSGGVALSLLSDPVHESHSHPAASVSAAGPAALPVAESADAPVLVYPPGNESSHPISLLSFVCICRRWPTVRGIPVPQAVTYCPGVGRLCYVIVTITNCFSVVSLSAGYWICS